MNPTEGYGVRGRPRSCVLASLLAAFLLAVAAPTFACVGDCDENGAVALGELLTGVSIALGDELFTACRAFDGDGDGAVGVNDLIAGIDGSLRGCSGTPGPSPTPTPTAIAETRCAVAPGDGVSFDPEEPFCELLSSYRFFLDGAEQVPNDGVLPYDLNTPLFSDYAAKHRFVWLPPATSALYDETDSFEFPVGTVVIKTFAYPFDARDPSLGERLLETRLLVRRAGGWDPITYIWNDAESEARRRIIGARLPVTWIDLDGESRSINYQVPNTNQCRECHEEHGEVLGLLGPKARNLNRDFAYADGTENQLARWSALGTLSGAPEPTQAPRAPVFDDPETGSVLERARAYLDVNCGNCHNPTGLARTSGLYLDVGETDPTRYGVCKPPVAAGQGSGNRRFDIVPGEPDASILVFRMESTAAGIAMPELGRQTVHEEGVAVVREWIAGLEGECAR
jgi:uncharacterized repeat protein (TIGR03806 family)